MNPDGEVASPTEPLPTRLFRLRLEKLVLLRGLDETEAAEGTVAQLRAMVAQIPPDNINVMPHLSELSSLATSDGWREVDGSRVEKLSREIAPLLRLLADVNLQVMTFEAKTERLAVAHLAGQTEDVARLHDEIAKDLALLPASLPEVQAQAEKLAWARSYGFWTHLDYDRIMELQATCAPLMRFRQRRHTEMVSLDLPDQIARRHWVIYGPSGEGAFANSYREQVEAVIRTLARDHPTLQKLRRGETLGEVDVRALANTLNRPDLFITEDALRQAYEQPDAKLVDFVRHILGLSYLASREEDIKAAFDRFLAGHPHFTATQIRFLRAVRSQVLRHVALTAQDLQRPPFTRIGDVNRLFDAAQVQEILDFATQLRLAA